MLNFSSFARYGAIHETSCYIALNFHKVVAYYFFFQPIGSKGWVFYHRKNNKFLPIYCCDEQQSIDYSSKSKDEIANADNSE